MTVKLTRNGKDKCPDWERIAEETPPALVGVLWNVLEDVIAARDSTVILEMYAAFANRWSQMSRAQRKRAAEEGEEVFFTERAFEQDDTNRRKARSLVNEQVKQGLIVGPNGDSPDRIM